MPDNPVLSTITLPSGTTYDLKDAYSRSEISSIKSNLTGAMHYIGVTTTALTDGSTTATISIDGVSKTLTASDAGSVVISGEKEFVWNGTKWQEFGSTGSLKALAFKDSASGSFTPAGSVSKPTFTGTQGSVSVSGTPAGSVTLAAATGSAGIDITPAGSVSQPTFTGTEGSVSVSHASVDGNVSFSNAPAGAGFDITPAGTVSQPTTTVEMNTTTVNSITAVGTLPSLTTSVSGENLTISFDAGTLPTKGSNTTVATTVKSATTTQPTFSGTTKKIVGAFSTGSVTSTGTFTPSGSVSQPTFSGTAKRIKATFSGNALTSTGDFTPAGSVSQPTFTGTAGTVTVS